MGRSESMLLCLLLMQGLPGGVSWERGSSIPADEDRSITDAGWCWREGGADEACWK